MQATQGLTVRNYSPLVGFAALAALGIFVVAILASAISGTINLASPAAGNAPAAATQPSSAAHASPVDVNAALVEVRRGERETTTPAQDKAQLEKAMIDFRRGEREPLGATTTPDAVNRGFGQPVAR
jgi:hypothetical protein